MTSFVTSRFAAAAALSCLAFTATAASAAPVYWTDWTARIAAASGVTGVINTGTTTMNVTYTGELRSSRLGPAPTTSLSRTPRASRPRRRRIVRLASTTRPHQPR